jgi:hypothetical protein
MMPSGVQKIGEKPEKKFAMGPSAMRLRQSRLRNSSRQVTAKPLPILESNMAAPPYVSMPTVFSIAKSGRTFRSSSRWTMRASLEIPTNTPPSDSTPTGPYLPAFDSGQR